MGVRWAMQECPRLDGWIDGDGVCALSDVLGDEMCCGYVNVL